MRTLTMHSDPGHGWLAVQKSELIDVGLNAQSFSRYSFRKGDWFFLEEDLDASKFISSYIAKYGEQPPIRDSYTDRNHPIRSYARAGQ